ncbi:hypothetical protein [Brachybacterium huguangmaarense]
MATSAQDPSAQDPSAQDPMTQPSSAPRHAGTPAWIDLTAHDLECASFQIIQQPAQG